MRHLKRKRSDAYFERQASKVNRLARKSDKTYPEDETDRVFD